MSLEFLVLVFVAISLFVFEVFKPRLKRTNFSGIIYEDFCWFFLNQIGFVLFFGASVYTIQSVVSGFLLAHSLSIHLTQFNWVAALSILLITQDFFSYWSHRALHSFSLLWEFHKVHHSSTQLYSLSAFRHSVFETLYHSVIIGCFTSVFVVTDQIRIVSQCLCGAVCLLQHSNIRIPSLRLLSAVFITPQNHYWHHSIEFHYKNGQNFGFIFVFWDFIFGTHYAPEHLSTKIGLKDPLFPARLEQKLIFPLNKLISTVLARDKGGLAKNSVYTKREFN